MLNILTNRYDPGKIGNLEIEVTMSEQHEYKNSITRFKVEEGFEITDHVHTEPEKVSISGIFSETPNPFRTNIVGNPVQGSGKSLVNEAIDSLIKIAGYSLPKQGSETTDGSVVILPEKKNKPQIVDLVTGLRAYTNMVCSSLTFPRDVTTGKSLRFSMDFMKIYTVESKIVAIDKVSDLDGKAPNIENQGPVKKATGKQPNKELKSTFANIADGVKSAFGGK